MITLTPTKDLGATAKAHPVVYSEPEQTVTDELLAGMVAIDGMNPAFIADLLSAYLTHERCGTHLYRSVAGRTNNPVLKAKYEEFGEETMRHVDILEQLIASTGGNPTYLSPLARAVEAADSHALMSTYLGSGGLDPMAAEMAMLDVVFMAEKAATQRSAKTAAQRTVAKQAVAKAPAQRGAAKKATDSTTTAKAARTSSATKAPSKKAPSKKAASKQAASKSSAAKTAPAKKASGKKGPAKKASGTASRRG